MNEKYQAQFQFKDVVFTAQINEKAEDDRREFPIILHFNRPLPESSATDGQKAC